MSIKKNHIRTEFKNNQFDHFSLDSLTGNITMLQIMRPVQYNSPLLAGNTVDLSLRIMYLWRPRRVSGIFPAGRRGYNVNSTALGMGQVYKAYQPALERNVATKLIECNLFW